MMNNAQLATASLDDIVFDGRNKAYGAYVLRAEYDRHVTRALIIASLLFALLISFPVLARLMKDDVAVPHGPISVPLEPMDLDTRPQEKVIPAVPEEKVEPQVRIERPSTVQFTPPTIVEDDRATAEGLASQDDLIEKDPGTVTYTNPNAGSIDMPVDLPPGNAVTADAVDNNIYVSVEQMPSLPGGGGMGAVVAAIQKAVRYPTIDVRNGVEGKVFASFIVNAQGDVVDIKIIKGLSATLDEETIRAIKALPKFIPGKQNGREVSVSFSVPITYKIQ